jgi:hypothetical protein
MAYVHISSGKRGARALAAARLAERATTEAERVAAEALAALVREQGVVAVSIEVHSYGRTLRLSDDAMLMVGSTVWWPALALVGLGAAWRFEPTGKALEQDDRGRWRAWFVGPIGEVESLRLRFAWALMGAAFTYLRHPLGLPVNRDAMLLAVVVGIVGASTQDAHLMAAPHPHALALWQEPAATPEQPAAPQGEGEGEATRNLRQAMRLLHPLGVLVDGGAGVGFAATWVGAPWRRPGMPRQ